MIDIILVVLLVTIVCVSSLYIYKEKKKGTKCIGCSSACTCCHKK